MPEIGSRSFDAKLGAMAIVGVAGVMLLAGVDAQGAFARARVLAPPGACVVADDNAFATEDGGCKDLVTWQVYSERKPQGTWSGALSQCNDLSEGGDVLYTDWVLPPKQGMIDAAAHGAGTHINYPGVDVYYPWSSDAAGGQNAWRVRYTDGDTKKALKSSWLLFNCRRYAGPTGLAATSISSSQIDLAWIDNSETETGFVLERSTDQMNWTPISLEADSQSYSDAGLSANTRYYYRLRATGFVTDSPQSAVVNAKTKR